MSHLPRPVKISIAVVTTLTAVVLVAVGWQWGLFEPRVVRLTRQLQTAKDPEQRADAARRLGHLGAAARPAAPQLVAALGDDGRFVKMALFVIPSEQHVHQYAFEALRQIGGDETIEALADALHRGCVGGGETRQQSNWLEYSLMAQLLAHFGQQSQPAAERVLEVVEHSRQGEITKQCLFALREMQIPLDSPAARKARPVLIKCCTNGGDSGRAASSMLYRLHPDDEEVLALWVRAMLSPLGGASAEGEIPINARTTPILIECLGEGTSEVALRRLRAARPEQVVPSLQAALQHAQPKVRAGAITLLGIFGTDGDVEASVFEPLLSDEDPEVRVAAATALWRCGDQVERPVRTLAEVLDGDHAAAQKAARAFLSESRPQDGFAVQPLAALLNASEPRVVRLAALELLASIGPVAQGANDELLKMLRDDDPELQRAAAKTVAAIEEKSSK